MPTPTTLFLEAGSGQQTLRNALFGSRIVGRVFDEDGNWMPGEAVQFDLPATLVEPSGRFSGGVFTFTTTTDANGRAESDPIQADDLLGTWFGEVAVVSMPSVRQTFYLANVDPRGAAANVIITANGTQNAAQGTAYAAVTARLVDGGGVGVVGTITQTIPAGRGTFVGGGTGRSVTTNASGYGTFPAIIASSTLGNFDPQVTFPAIPVAHCNFTTIDPAVATSMSTYSGNNQSTPPNFLFANPLVIRVANGINGPVAGVPVLFDAPNAGASLVWALPATDPVTAISDSNGLATAPSASANATAGTYNVVVTSPGLITKFFQLTNGGAPPSAASSALLISEA